MSRPNTQSFSPPVWQNSIRCVTSTGNFPWTFFTRVSLWLSEHLTARRRTQTAVTSDTFFSASWDTESLAWACPRVKTAVLRLSPSLSDRSYFSFFYFLSFFLLLKLPRDTSSVNCTLWHCNTNERFQCNCLDDKMSQRSTVQHMIIFKVTVWNNSSPVLFSLQPTWAELAWN